MCEELFRNEVDIANVFTDRKITVTWLNVEPSNFRWAVFLFVRRPFI